ncbi:MULTISPECIES: sensor histidine kinase [unclassified Curtobacterium]|uniref:sensor histidine kinase n=1 Tax=unclassified Curtobacterium TaxID=257496 RepID=UPI000F45FED7|nr:MULTISPECIES: sensor histidine kinase [unclassified Curtobacterium]ROQ05740.1 signal transduction histidine kinase [Curtobacterium sp. PhB171]ROQ23113.1 signal transduction histidine kinase [Curtobacterium sp. PhB170]ROS33935.1 signal transduction histidine kinase [Curtobacterium sp. PhB131]ROS66534.1 signal transduction histidine kinase [Curtobacterium sp. PhB141]
MSGETWVRGRWLHVFFAGTMLLTAVITALGWSPWSTRWPAYVAVVVLVVAYIAYGHRGYDSPRAAAAFLPLVIVAALVLPAVVPSTAFVQCIVFPLVWVQTERVRTAILLSIAVGLASGLGLQLSSGPDALVSTLLIEGISVIGACAMGVWISSVAGLSEERRQLVEELRATQQSLADANRTAGIASERERLAREIHDTVAQNLAGIVMLTERARGDLANDRSDALEERLTVLEESARAALEESRTLVAAGAAGMTRDSLAGALHRLAERHTRETGTLVTVDASDCVLDRDAQVVLLRVAQEALSNVRAHAGSASARVLLLSDAGQTVLRITDDGTGFDPEQPTAGHGLRGLRERLALAGGTCTITSALGRRTVVEATLPTGAAPGLPSAVRHPVAEVSR